MLAHIGTFMRAWPMGYDPYFYLAGRAAEAGYPPLFGSVVSLAFSYPWLTAIFFTTILAGLTFHIASKFGAKRPWLATVLLFSAPQFIFRTAVIEDDLLGVAFTLLLLLAYVIWEKKGTWITLGLAGFIGLVGMLTWRGTLFYILAIGINEGRKHTKLAYIVPLLAFLYFSSIVVPTGESVLGVYYIALGIGILTYSFYSLKKPLENKTLMVLFYTFAAVALAQARWIWLVVPFAAIVTSELAGDWLVEKKVGSAVLGFAIAFGLLFANVGIYTEQPTNQTMQDIFAVANITEGEPIANDWQYGHWLKYAGANALYTNLIPQAELDVPENVSWVLCSHNTDFPATSLAANFSSFALLRVP